MLVVTLAFLPVTLAQADGAGEDRPSAIQFENPSACWKSQADDCAIGIGARYTLHWHKSEIFAVSGTLIQKRGVELELVDGKLWVQCRRPLAIKTVFADFEMTEGEFWLEVVASGKKVEARVLSGELRARTRDQKLHTVPAGFENWFAGAGLAGLSQVGIPRAFDVMAQIRAVTEFFGADREVLKARLAGLRKTWNLALNQSADLYRDVIRIEDGWEAERVSNEAAARRRLREENMKLRKLFQQKNFLDLDPDAP
jgi:hypothetical protein